MYDYKKAKKNYLIIDFNQIIYQSLFALRKNEKDANIMDEVRIGGKVELRMKDEAFDNQFRNYFWNTMLGIVGRFKDLKQVIICQERSSWRKEVFPHYKYKRKTGKTADTFDWRHFFNKIKTFEMDEVNALAPFVPMKVERCEGDDVIGVLATALSQEYPNSTIYIHSSDKDFIQLLKFENVKLYSPLKRKFTYATNPKNELLALILLGDLADGIPNIFNKDDAYVNPIINEKTGKKLRSAPLGDKKVRKAISENNVYQSLINTPERQQRFDQNQMLIDLEKIPMDVKKSVIEEYKNQVENLKKKSPAALQRYLIMNGLQQVSHSLPKILHLFV